MPAVLTRIILLLSAVLAFAASGLALAAEPAAGARQAWQLLDYIAVDYPAAVQKGQVVDAGEYAEMQEFTAAVSSKLATLPADAGREGRLATAKTLQRLVAERAPEDQIARTAGTLASELLAVYKIEAAPAAAPDLERGAALYAQQCTACHGASGRGDGPAASGMDPPPIAFTDAARAMHRSPLSLYQVISQGLPGTAMASYAHLSNEDRWALAYYTGGLAYDAAARTEGATVWAADSQARGLLADLAAVSRSTEAELAKSIAAEKARAITGYLRSNPEVVLTAPTAVNSNASLALARQQLRDSVAAYRAGDSTKASALALSAYLDGVEPVEPQLGSRDRALLRKIESAMAVLRSSIGKGAPAADVEAQAAAVVQLLDRSEKTLATDTNSATTAFIGSFTILLREGVEALLIVIGMIAFLRKAQRQDVLPYVHAGWIGALLAGVVTWAVATYAVSISGAEREVTEGFSALFAAVVLLSVGIWMHQKSMAGRWQQYLQEKMSAALTRRSAAFLFVLSFVAVYREVFETILFYAAMWNEQDISAILAGLVSGLFVLALIAFALLRLGTRLPIGQFFRYSSILIAVLAVVLVGKGVAALQEAGWIGQALVAAPQVEWLGLYPTWQSILAQLVVAAIAIFGFLANTRGAKVAP
jgi:high-affinity iron transporter